MHDIALISEHASPLAAAGSTDSGGQNVYVAHLARQLAALGHRVDVYTRRDRHDQGLVVNWLPGIRVIQVPVGPPHYLCKESLMPCMEAFGDFMLQFMKRTRQRYDILHANFFMSGMVATPRSCAFISSMLPRPTLDMARASRSKPLTFGRRTPRFSIMASQRKNSPPVFWQNHFASSLVGKWLPARVGARDFMASSSRVADGSTPPSLRLVSRA